MFELLFNVRLEKYSERSLSEKDASGRPSSPKGKVMTSVEVILFTIPLTTAESEVMSCAFRRANRVMAAYKAFFPGVTRMSVPQAESTRINFLRSRVLARAAMNPWLVT